MTVAQVLLGGRVAVAFVIFWEMAFGMMVAGEVPTFGRCGRTGVAVLDPATTNCAIAARG